MAHALRNSAALTTLLLLALLGRAAGAAPPPVLEAVPADALAVLRIADLKATNAKAMALAARLYPLATGQAIELAPPGLRDPLSACLAQLGVRKGLDTTGQAALVFFAPREEGGPPPLVLLLPLAGEADAFDAFLGNYTAIKLDPGTGIARLTLRDEPFFYARRWGDYAALAADAELLKKAPAGLTVPAACAAEMARRDIALFANVPALAKLVLPRLKEDRAAILDALGGDADDPDLEPAARRRVLLERAWVEVALQALERALADGRGAALGVALTDAGVQFGVMFSFDAESATGRFAATFAAGQGAGPMLDGLPEGDHLLTAAIALDGAAVAALVADASTVVRAGVAHSGAGAEAVESTLAAWRACLGAIGSAAFAGDWSERGERSVALLRTPAGREREAVEAWARARQGAGKIQALFPPFDGAAERVGIVPGATTVEGATLDRVRLSLNVGEDLDPAQRAALDLVYATGRESRDLLAGPVGEGRAVVIAGDGAWARTAVRAARGDAAPAAARVQATAAALPRERFAVAYLDLDRAVGLLTSVLAAAGAPEAIAWEPSGKAPHLGASARVEGSALAVEAHVPAGLLDRLAAGYKAIADRFDQP